MPVIVLASPKGGCGKTTAALLLSTELAQKGIGVTVIDADPETYIDTWAKLPDKPPSLRVKKSPTEQTILDDIDKAKQESPFVIIDLEGTANMLVAYAISRADLVIIPLQPSDLDARGAAKALQLVRQQQKAFNRTIPHAILFTRTKAAIRTRTFTHIAKQLTENKITIFKTHLLEREVYRALFSYGGCLENLDPKDVYHLQDAINNARAFAGEVIAMVNSSHAPSARPANELEGVLT
jgi:chromosome partitioning protein